ncbi:MAG: hypothetical protein LBD08_09015 [Treponema sp.]|nr:hypothetical protein [Treponema sp.]
MPDQPVSGGPFLLFMLTSPAVYGKGTAPLSPLDTPMKRFYSEFMEVIKILAAPVCGIIGAMLVAFINNKNTDKKFHKLFSNHLHGLAQYLKVLNSALLKKQVIDEIDKQRLDNEADNICSQ